MTVVLTSFKVFHEDLNRDATWSGRGYSIAVYQPKWFPQLPKLDLFDIRDDSGGWIRPGLFKGQSEPLYRYHERLLFNYRQRWVHEQELGQNGDLIKQLVPVFDENEDTALCCWCPYDQAAKRQMAEFGSFVCHSWVVETFLTELGVSVVRDEDRADMVVTTW